MLAPTVTSGKKSKPSVERSSLKPSSFIALLTQDILIPFKETTVAVRLDGSAGEASRTVKLTVIERLSEPLVPVTIKL